MSKVTSKRHLLVCDRDGQFRIEIPEDWKVTFGTAGGNRGGGYDRELRLYEGNEKQQRACFTGVLWFRDTSIPVVRKMKRKSGEVVWEEDSSGNYQRNESIKIEEYEENE